MASTHYYFASDFHLGVPSYKSSRERERRLVRWLDHIKTDAHSVFLMGDVFDFWFEYRTVVPKGYIRLFGKLAELSDAGVQLYIFKGNHDMWMFDYFEKELGAKLISDELLLDWGGKRFFLHHGDGLGDGDRGYKFLKHIFRSRFCQWLFARLHPNFGVGIANYWSQKSRLAGNKKQAALQVDFEEKWLKGYYESLHRAFGKVDYLVMGHRHFPIELRVKDLTYVNLGEWVNFSSYAVFDGESLQLKHFESEAP
ncbi:UDP-2,3-diacylglucosamine diphosphatase [Pelobium manganitolerans]|uniref:UDP-2,3-diacylglucosamine diphosphatase n=1 Tax=Pelobium manganitolerans TaxID=1842495 RepID=UPI003FA35A92